MAELRPVADWDYRPEWYRVTLDSIGDAVIATDTEGRVTFLNPVAESLTGWTQNEAAGVTLEQVFKIINHGTRQTVESPTVRALRDGVERPIGPTDDSAAPIRNHQGELTGVLLVFRDISELYRK